MGLGGVSVSAGSAGWSVAVGGSGGARPCSSIDAMSCIRGSRSRRARRSPLPTPTSRTRTVAGSAFRRQQGILLATPKAKLTERKDRFGIDEVCTRDQRVNSHRKHSSKVHTNVDQIVPLQLELDSARVLRKNEGAIQRERDAPRSLQSDTSAGDRRARERRMYRKELDPLALISAKDRQVRALLRLARSEETCSLRARQLNIFERTTRLQVEETVSSVSTREANRTNAASMSVRRELTRSGESRRLGGFEKVSSLLEVVRRKRPRSQLLHDQDLVCFLPVTAERVGGSVLCNGRARDIGRRPGRGLGIGRGRAFFCRSGGATEEERSHSAHRPTLVVSISGRARR